MPNKALQPIAQPLRGFASAELRRWASEILLLANYPKMG